MAAIKENIKNLMEQIDNNSDSEDREMEKELINDFAKDCAEYISSVANMENAINVGRFQLSTSEYQKMIIDLDKARAMKHNVVISGVKVLNRLCLLYNLKAIYTGDTNSRIEIAEFAKQYVDELWDERRI